MQHVTSWVHHGWDLAPLVTASCLIYLKEMPYPGHLVSSQSKQLPWPPSWQTPGVRGRIWHRLEVLGVGGYLASRMSRMLDDPIVFWWTVFTFAEACWMHNQFWSQSLFDGPLSHLWLTWWWILLVRGTAGKEMPPLLPLFEEVLEISCWARNSWQTDTWTKIRSATWEVMTILDVHKIVVFFWYFPSFSLRYQLQPLWCLCHLESIGGRIHYETSMNVLRPCMHGHMYVPGSPGRLGHTETLVWRVTWLVKREPLKKHGKHARAKKLCISWSAEKQRKPWSWRKEVHRNVNGGTVFYRLVD